MYLRGRIHTKCLQNFSKNKSISTRLRTNRNEHDEKRQREIEKRAHNLLFEIVAGGEDQRRVKTKPVSLLSINKLKLADKSVKANETIGRLNFTRSFCSECHVQCG